ncbi:Hypp9585 [Branchiostoma lanceolatum]|uniref:Hypp9585 protein n=1 Tax=Branchiostoma lanceolatum TaxID=7740 RepID=A0A8S4MN70_BRALA|nr:Hypp9585 [Branchiostoma lanceolatum]
MGDINIKEVDWEAKCTTAGNNHHSQLLLDCLDDNFMFQHVTRPTRYRVNQTPSTLDLVITNEEDTVGEIQYDPGLGKGDHCCLSFNICRQAQAPTHDTLRRNYNKASYTKARQDLQVIDWDGELNCTDVSEAWSNFSGILNNIIDECVPQSRSKQRPDKLYMNSQAMKAKKRKRKAWGRWKQTKAHADFIRYAIERNSLRSLTRDLRSKFEHRLVKDIKNNPKSFWKYTKSRLHVRQKVGALVRSDGSTAQTDQEKAEELNNFFASVFTSEDLSTIPRVDARQSETTLGSLEVTEEAVRKKLEALNPNKSAGPDNIHPRILRELAGELAYPLAILFNKSLKSAKLPEEWKVAHITPIHKKGARTQAGNYRPVSLTSVVGKTMEAIIRDALVRHMSAGNHFTDAQHGFVPGRSCMTQLLVVLEEWTQLLEKGEAIDAIYLDFRKAFDAVPHQRLLCKLGSYGVKGDLYNWVKDFLASRKQRVVLNGTSSSWTPVRSGIPQGSVLGPVLFVVYINDLPEAVSSTVRIFADDSKLYQGVKDNKGRVNLQKDLEALRDWSASWQLPFNVGKCKVLHMGNNNNRQIYTLGDQVLEETTAEKDLGVTVDNHLKFHTHTAQAKNKGNQMLGLIKKSFANLDEQTLPILFKTMVRPHLEYGNVIWGPHYKAGKQELEKVQRRATKMVPSLRELPYSTRLQRLKLPSLEYRRLRGDMIQVFKIMNGIDRILVQSFFAPVEQSVTRGHSLKLQVPLAKTRARSQVFSVRTVSSWNALPESVVSADSVNQFKSRLDKHWDCQKYVT